MPDECTKFYRNTKQKACPVAYEPAPTIQRYITINRTDWYDEKQFLLLMDLNVLK